MSWIEGSELARERQPKGLDAMSLKSHSPVASELQPIRTVSIK